MCIHVISESGIQIVEFSYLQAAVIEKRIAQETKAEREFQKVLLLGIEKSRVS